MRGASRESLAAAREWLDRLTSPQVPTGLAQEVFAVADTCHANPSLRTALTAPAVEGVAKAALARDVFGSHLSAPAVDLLSRMVGMRWSTPSEFVDGLDALGVQTVVTEADQTGVLDQLESDLFAFGQAVAGAPELRSALTDRAVPDRFRVELVRSLLAGRTDESTRQLLARVITAPRGLTFETALRQLSEEVAARRERRVATVVSAIALTTQQRDRLLAALSAKFGGQVYLNVVIDADVIGGLRVTVGDQVIDGTIATRLDETRLRLAG
jgi:F-type H+-transporting ATPase subunit delta